jgi:hypothetical protein
MNSQVAANHAIEIPLPVDQCQRLFTPAGEELWADGWAPTYHHPRDGATTREMVFTTGTGDQYTIWSLVDFDTELHYARYCRVTPALRAGFVEVRCTSLGAERTRVEVSYTLTALTEAGKASLRAFEPAAFEAMIEGWRESIVARLPQLALAVSATGRTGAGHIASAAS